MSKEYLIALNKIQHDFGQLKGQELVKCYETIFNGLKRLEAIDNAKPSEALKWLEKSKNMMIENNGDFIAFECLKVYSVCKQALLKAQEQEKVLDIIKEKNVDIIRIRHLIFKSQKNPKYWDLRYYNEGRVIDNEKLTQEEFDLLKRYFNGSK